MGTLFLELLGYFWTHLSDTSPTEGSSVRHSMDTSGWETSVGSERDYNSLWRWSLDHLDHESSSTQKDPANEANATAGSADHILTLRGRISVWSRVSNGDS